MYSKQIIKHRGVIDSELLNKKNLRYRNIKHQFKYIKRDKKTIGTDFTIINLIKKYYIKRRANNY